MIIPIVGGMCLVCGCLDVVLGLSRSVPLVFVSLYLRTIPFNRLCLQCSASVNVKKVECVYGHEFCKWRSNCYLGEQKDISKEN